MIRGSTVPRAVWATVADALLASPVVAVTGPRTAGKSTFARELVARTRGTYLDLDDPQVRSLARDDPGAFVTNLAEPVVIDEFQRAPEILAAIKAELNRGLRPGRYVLTGSTRHRMVPELADHLTGRVDLIDLWPFAVAELVAPAPNAVDRLFEGTFLDGRRIDGVSRSELVELVLRGGYPIGVGLADRARTRWFMNLANLVVERLGDGVPPSAAARAGRFLALLAARTGQVVTAAEIGREMELAREPAADLLRLLEVVYLVVLLPAWSASLSSRITKRPKLHLVDSGLAAALTGATAAGRASAADAGGLRYLRDRLGDRFVTGVVLTTGAHA